MQKLLLLGGCLLMLLPLRAQQFFQFTDASSIQLSENALPVPLLPEQYRTLEVDFSSLRQYLQKAPQKGSQQGLPLVFPMPDGQTLNVEAWAHTNMEPALAKKYPDIQSYVIRSPDRKYSGNLDLSIHGWRAQLIGNGREILIDPMARMQQAYSTVYDSKHYTGSLDGTPSFQCGVEGQPVETDPVKRFGQDRMGAVAENRAAEDWTALSYTIAIACTGEFAQLAGGTVPAALAEINTILNRVNTVYGRDAGIQFSLQANNDLIIFLNGSSDPYTNGNTGAMLSENPGVLNTIIGGSNFDIGHVLGTNAGGLASLGVVCTNFEKAQGVSCRFGNFFGFNFYIIVCHEIGHQFSAQHTFNNCEGNENSGTAFEPGSGNTIMGYSGAGCALWNQNVGDPYFHVNSLEAIQGFSRGANGISCAQESNAFNSPPEAIIPLENGFSIPRKTPFELEGIGLDMDDDSLTYTWEQYDLGTPVPVGQEPLAIYSDPPSFKYFPPAPTPIRICPGIERVVNNDYNSRLEFLPDSAREFTWRFTVRDNAGPAAGSDWAQVKFQVAENAGPFRVSLPDTQSTVSWVAGQDVPVEWQVAQTDQPPVNCQRVDIYLSLDGGFTYPILLLDNAPNTGSATVVVPNIPTTQARIKVKAHDNIFFDISNQNFEIVPATEPGVYLTVSPNSQTVCLPDTAMIQINSEALLGYDSLLTITNTGPLPAGAVVLTESVLPSQGGTLRIDLTQVSESGVFPFNFQFTGPGLDTLVRTFELDITSTDFSDLALLSPADGAAGLTQFPSYSWEPSSNATEYAITIASNPSFSENVTIESAEGLTNTSFTSTVLLNKAQVYYWKVRASNECGFREDALPRAFATIAEACTDVPAKDLPKTISSLGLPTVTSTVVVSGGGVLSDLNVTKLRGSHDRIRDINVSLIGPDATEVFLFQDFKCVVPNFDLGFDSESANIIDCGEVKDGKTFMPDEPLTAFNGKNPEGDWTLKVEVVDEFGNGGTLEELVLQLCSDVNLSPPFLVNNDTLKVQKGKGTSLTSDFLFTDDNDNNPEELRYTLVLSPGNGQLLLDNDTIQQGGQFFQADLNQAQMVYQHLDTFTESDHFYFIVDDQQGGFVGITRFEIITDPEAPFVSVDDLESRIGGFRLYPNPAREQVQFELNTPLEVDLQLDLYHLSGQRVQRHLLPAGTQQYPLQVGDLPRGMYFLRLQGEQGTAALKLLLQ